MQSSLASSSFRNWWPYAAGLLGTAGAALVIGLPTDVIPNGYFTRMTPVRYQDYIFLALTMVLTGLVAASYAVRLPGGGGATGKVTTAGLLGFLAIGCPVCNKLVLLLLGTSGALSYWAPLQPAVGAVSVSLLGITLLLRLRRLRSGCPMCV